VKFAEYYSRFLVKLSRVGGEPKREPSAVLEPLEPPGSILI
jgi:hypothetical protein